MKIGVPVENVMFSNKDIAAILEPNDSFDSSETIIKSSLEFLKFRETSQNIDNFVLIFEKFHNITEIDDINTGLNLWNSIENSMVNFMENISFATNQINQWMIDLDIAQNDQSYIDSIYMMTLYLDIFDRMVYTVSNSSKAYKEAFNFIEHFNPRFNIKNTNVSKYL